MRLRRHLESPHNEPMRLVECTVPWIQIFGRWLLIATLASALAPVIAAAQETAASDPPDAGAASPAIAQPPPTMTMSTYVPITGLQRTDWVVVGTIGPRSLGVGVIADIWQTGFNVPEEWGRGWSGIGKRYLQREADVAISSAIEAGAGALWGEDPRYIPSGRRGLWPRVRYALRTVMLAQRPDGHLAPAWGRYAGNVFNNVIENTWLPPSATTTGQTVLRSVNGFLGRAGGNLFDEFWPDVRRRLKK
jgi:hypothetical protein